MMAFDDVLGAARSLSALDRLRLTYLAWLVPDSIRNYSRLPFLGPAEPPAAVKSYVYCPRNSRALCGEGQMLRCGVVPEEWRHLTRDLAIGRSVRRTGRFVDGVIAGNCAVEIMYLERASVTPLLPAVRGCLRTLAVERAAREPKCRMA